VYQATEKRNKPLKPLTRDVSVITLNTRVFAVLTDRLIVPWSCAGEFVVRLGHLVTHRLYLSKINIPRGLALQFV